MREKAIMAQKGLLARGTLGDGFMKDPINEELHKYREEHARQFNFDLRAICEDLRAMQQSSNLKVVRLPPKRIGPKSRSKAT
jgi:hypothetical protein